jgi:hypothetical protein
MGYDWREYTGCKIVVKYFFRFPVGQELPTRSKDGGGQRSSIIAISQGDTRTPIPDRPVHGRVPASLSPVLAPFFIMPSLSSHLWFSMRHHPRIFIGNRSRWSRLAITSADDAQDAKRQEPHEYLCDHSVFLTVFVSYSKFFTYHISRESHTGVES